MYRLQPLPGGGRTKPSASILRLSRRLPRLTTAWGPSRSVPTGSTRSDADAESPCGRARGGEGLEGRALVALLHPRVPREARGASERGARRVVRAARRACAGRWTPRAARLRDAAAARSGARLPSPACSDDREAA